MINNYNFIKASELRLGKNMQTIPDNKNGYYKWWATGDFFYKILEKLNLIDDKNLNGSIKNAIEKKENLFCIYLGIAPVRSLRERIDSHINQNNSKYNVRHSTLRKSLTSLFVANKSDCIGTNELINELWVEFFPSELPFGDPYTKMELENLETELLKNNFYILNLDKNKHPLTEYTVKKIKILRKK